jgi:hypothetical protein
MSARIHSPRFAGLLAGAASVFAISCAEKVSRPEIPASPRFTLQVNTVTQQSAAAQKLFVAAVYFSSVLDPATDSARFLDTATVAITGGPQTITMRIDLSACLADQTRRGSRTACSMYIGAFLEPQTFNLVGSNDPYGGAFDYQILGPFDAAPGRAPSVPSIDLAASRFAVNHWEVDEALRLGGDLTPSFLTGPIAGAATGTGAPTLFGLTNGLQVVNAGPNATGYVPIAQLAVWQNGTWRRIPGPANITFNDVAALSPTDVYIAGSDGLYHYDGTSIAAVNAVRESLRSVAVTPPSASARFVVAGTANGGIWVSNLTTYTRYSTNTAQVIDGVCITGATEAFASSRSGGGLFRFDGTTLTSVASTFTQSKTDLQCAGPGQAFVAVQTSPTTLLRWGGQGWVSITAIPPVVGRTLEWAVVSANEIYAVGDSANVNRAFYRFDGLTWREVGRTTFTGGLSLRPWADPRGGAAYAASSNFGSLRVESMSASAVSVVSYQPSMRDVIMPTTASAFAVGSNYFLARWNGARWSVDAPPAGTPTNAVLQGVWADSPTNAWVAGGQSTIARWDGARWSIVSDARRPIVAPSDNYNAVWGASGTVWLAGDASILRCTAAGGCTPDVVAGTGPLYSIWGTSATNAFAVGAGGRVLRYDGKSWTTMTSPTGARLSRVWGSGPSDVWAIGDTVAIHYDGNAWKLMTQSVFENVIGYQSNPVGSFQLGLWGASAREVYATSWFGQIRRGETVNWGAMLGPFQGGGRIVGIAGAPGGCAIAVTDGQSGLGGPVLLRGVGPTGCLGTAMTGPASWP